MKYKIVILYIFIVFIIFNKSRGQERPESRNKQNTNQVSLLKRTLIPDILKIQFAGGIGMVSVGLGQLYAHDKIESAYLYGFTPPMNEAKAIHSLSHQIIWHSNGFRIKDKFESKFILGCGISIFFNAGESFIRLPAKYPENYYPANAFRISMLLGLSTSLSVNNKNIDHLTLNIALNTDNQLINGVIQDYNTGKKRMFHLSLGLTTHLRKKY